ncbi:protein-disulfide reductase DsbD [Legionella oakridgensis]|uniref:Thiol:disulfide interchange protein n=2 Tax=Legionella oakridgensis TaxID=29423 RepID=A0A0W0XIS8_9GAMM|nr:protein-disulfide reductase DsbD [Legionella oakridgensis]KTD44543.1 thiol:disulfide interchange protein [Legionella oakridgensis]STY21046.1 thiol:disulfide interchange protein [Legionella longbeachae]
MKKITLSLGLLLLALPSFAANIGSTHPTEVMTFIQNHNPLVYLALFFGLGILLAFTPCVLPMVPILSGIITGQQANTGKRAFRLSLGYVSGMAITYAAAGMLAAYFGSTVQTLMQQPIIIASFSSLFVLMALWLFGMFELRIPAAFQVLKPKSARTQPGVISAVTMGILSTLVVSPCVTAPLIGILAYIGQSGHILQGGLILFVLALGMGLPLLVVGAGYGKLLPQTGPWMIKIKQLFALLMLAMAIWLLGRILPEFWLSLLWTSFLVLGAFIFIQWQQQSLGFNQYFFQGLALVTCMIGGALAYKSIDLEKNTPHPAVTSASFIMVHSLNDLHQHLAQAKKHHQPVFVEFFASWCSDCQAMEKQVFNQSSVLAAMSNSLNLRVDISEKNEEVRAIRKAFNIYGIPTMIFYNTTGQKLDNLTSVGQITKTQMLDLLSQFNKSPKNTTQS